MAKKKATKKEVKSAPKEKVSVGEAKAKPMEKKPKVKKTKPCSDCTVLLADGGKSGFKYPRAGLLDSHTLCDSCEGSGIVVG